MKEFEDFVMVLWQFPDLTKGQKKVQYRALVVVTSDTDFVAKLLYCQLAQVQGVTFETCNAFVSLHYPVNNSQKETLL